ncbi:MAG: ATP-binding cassette domain-containing protein, partial [Actinomycetales bacterium]
MSALLEVKDLQISFGGVKAVNGLSFTANANEIISVIGPNGAGKTSAFNCITGFYKPTSGQVLVDGQDITGKRPAVIAATGVTRTFQNLRLFPDLTVLDN